EFSSATSQPTGTTRAFGESSSAAVRSAPARSTSAIATAAPSPASVCANARPNPVAPPVMNATFPANRSAMSPPRCARLDTAHGQGEPLNRSSTPKRGPYIVSVADHVVEPPHTWESRLPGKLRERGPRAFDGPDGVYWEFNGERMQFGIAL